MRSHLLVLSSLLIVVVADGCALREIRSKTKAGVEYRRKNVDKTEHERYLVQESVQFKWDNGVDTSMIYRRRDLSDNESGDHDDGIWFEVSVPIWKAKSKPDLTAARVEDLEQRIRELEARLAQTQNANVIPASAPGRTASM